MRVKRGVVRRAKHKKIFKQVKGFSGRKKSVFKLAKQAMLKAGQFSYRDRRNKKRVFRSSWIVKINAAAHEYGMSYSVLINKLSTANILINRKILADLAENEPQVLNAIISKVK